VSYLWSQVSGPSIAIILTPGSQSTFVTSLNSGLYTFQLSAIDNKGAVGVDSVTITVTQNNIPHGLNKPPVVNAGRDTTFDFTNSTSDSIHLTGTAIDYDGSVASFLWSQVSGPNTAKIHNPGTASTYISEVISGQYVFQLMAVDNNGATGVKSVIITVIKPQFIRTTFVLNNSTNDLHLAVNYIGDVTDPTLPEIGASTWTFGGSPAYQRGLLRFDLSSLPQNIKIQSAKLTLYSNPRPTNGDLIHANYGINNSILIQRVSANWNSSTTWQTQPSTEITGQIVIPHTNQSLMDLVDLDVTDLIKRMMTEGNYGFMLKLQNESYYNSRIFCSSKFSDVSKHPKLVVEYMK
jgi:hypothetical protein